MSVAAFSGRIQAYVFAFVFALSGVFGPGEVRAEVTAFKQAVAEAAARDKDIAAFYKATGYEPIWTQTFGKDAQRRRALFRAMDEAQLHGLPAERFGAKALMAQLRAANSPRARGLAEVALSRAFLDLAQAMQTGALVPKRIDEGIVRKVPYRDRGSYLSTLVQSNPNGFFRALPPRTPEYARLLKAKLAYEKRLGAGGFGATVPSKSLKPGQSGAAVVALRDRLVRMGYLRRSASPSYDGALQEAVQRFQADHGLTTDGIAGAGTLAEINTSAEERLKAIIVALERERWVNSDRGKRHVLVNITDFSARIVDDGKVTFQTRSVVGANDSDRRTPEFSDVMEFMVINPTWNVPRSIATKEYLPMMQNNANAASHLELYDSRGRKVARSNINFANYTARSFPYAIKQPPSRRNALGLVKFMFPNKYNIYLHDTPAKNLFSRETRAYSHGCVRLNDPFDFAYALLAKQSRDPKGQFHRILDTGKETVVTLEKEVPVHIIYRTAFTDAKGKVHFRRDIYGRDAKIWRALAKEGVVLRASRG